MDLTGQGDEGGAFITKGCRRQFQNGRTTRNSPARLHWKRVRESVIFFVFNVFFNNVTRV